MDLLEICLEEIALEGLEGITIPTLWLRLENRLPPLPYQLSDALKEYLWRFIVQHDSLGIYSISKDRLEPQIFDRFEGRDEHGIPTATAPDELGTLVDVYSQTALTNVENVRGACSDYNSRVDMKNEISDLTCKLTLELYGARRLIVVASQTMRETIFLLPNMSTTVIAELTDFMYCVLERVARARWQGELQAVLNRMNFCGNKSMHVHYVVNRLQKLGLVVKKNHTYKRSDKNNRATFQVLIFQKRFEQDCLTFSVRAAQNAIEILKSCPDHSMNMAKLRDMLQLDERQFKTLYRGLQKSGSAVTHDINPNKRAKNLSMKVITLTNKPENENLAEDEDDDDQDIQMMFARSSQPAVRPLVLERPIVYQSFAFVTDNGAKGVVQRQVLKFLKGYGRLESRNVCKIFARMNLVNVVLVDHGKQRMQSYIPKNLSTLSESSIEFSDEKKKMQQLLMKTASFTSKNLRKSSAEKSSDNLHAGALSPYCESYGKSQDSGMSATVEETSLVVIGDKSFECLGEDKIDPDSRADRLNFLLQDDYRSNATHLKKWDAHLTTRKIKRHNVVLEQLNQEKIIQGYRSLQRCLSATEEKEGVTTKIDKKTVVRLIDKMHYEGVLQHSVIPVVHNGRTVNFHFIMSLDCPPSLLKTTVDQARFKLLGDEEHRVARLEQTKLRDEMKEERKMKKELLDGSSVTSDKSSTMWPKVEKLAQKFFQPKFKRLRVLHSFLWYLVYGHPQSQNWTPDMEIADPDELKIHDEENCWRRFLPPAPIHFHDGVKWLQLGDIAVILPLSIFCKFHRVIHKHDELEQWLADEEKRHVLVRHLPQDIRSSLFYKRRYMFSLMTCIEQLALMGLVTMRRGRMGNNFNMPKENMLIYINKNVSILDTRSSAKQHVMVENKPYEKIFFTLDNLHDVEEYWYKLQDICAQTRLGFTHCQSDDGEMVKHANSSEMKKSTSVANEIQSQPADNGESPGDQRGAGGLDSSMYSYLYRNWGSKPNARRAELSMRDSDDTNFPIRLPKLRQRSLALAPAAKKRACPDSDEEPEDMVTTVINSLQGKRTNERKMPRTSNQSGSTDAKTNAEEKRNGAKKRRKTSESSEEKKAKMVKTRTKQNQKEASEPMSQDTDSDEPQVVMVSNVGRNNRVKGGKGVKRKKSEKTIVMELPKKKRKREMSPRNRKPQQVQQGKQKLKYVDKRDLEAIEHRKGRIRVQFARAEDELFLLCHIATSLLTQLFWKKRYRPRKQLVPWPLVRDVVQAQLQESRNKTSYSVARRTLYLMKDPETRIYHDISVADIKVDLEFLRRTLPEQFDFYHDAKSLPEIYKKLVKHLQERSHTQPGLFDGEIPETCAELERLFSPKSVLRKIDEIQKKRRLFHDEITCHDDITKAVAENMTHIALSMGDAEFSVYQAYRAFETFPDRILSEIFVLMQVSGIVCTKTTMVRRLPFGIRSHRLAHAHSQSLKASIPKGTMDEMCDAMDCTANISVDVDVPAGHILLLSYFLTKGGMDISIDVPDQVILPDAPNTQLFENQFSAMLEDTKEDILKEMQEAGLAPSGEDNLVPSNSVMAAAACVLRESLEDDGKSERDPVSVAAAADTDEARLKITEILKLYRRHPSYTNWLMLINPQRNNEISEAKFRNLNYALNSDSVVLNPCKVVLLNTQELISKHVKNFAVSFEMSQRQRPELISAYLDSAKLNFESSETAWKQYIKKPRAVAQRYLAKAIFDEIEKAAKIGLTKTEICESLNFEERTVSSVLDDLVEKLLVFSVGVGARVYVTYHHAQPWTAKGFDFCGPDSNFRSEISHEIELLQRAKSQEKEKSGSAAQVGAKTPERAVKDTMDLAPQATRSVKNLYKEVQFVCRPWHTICGDVSFKAARTLLLSVYLKVLASPGITREKLFASYTFQPVCIIELLEVLCRAGCVVERVLEASKSKRMFDFFVPKTRTVYYETTQDGMITVGQWCRIVEDMVGRMAAASPSRA